MTRQQLIELISQVSIRVSGTQRQLNSTESEALSTEVDKIALRTLNEARAQRNQLRADPVIEADEYRKLCVSIKAQEQLVEARAQERQKHQKTVGRLRKELESDSRILADLNAQLKGHGQVIPFRKEDSDG